MTRIINLMIAITLLIIETTFAQNGQSVEQFDKVIVSPHIQVTLVESNEETVTVESISVAEEKLHIEVDGKTLRIYLEDAKEVTKSEKVMENGREVKRPIYKGTIVVATVSYKKLEELSVRGEETLVCKSPLVGDEFKLIIYGESQVFLNEVTLKELNTTIYGESELEIKSGSIDDQRFIAYGEAKINALKIKNEKTKITAYGEAEFKINASKRIKITSYGEASLEYKGKADIKKGLNIGGVKISKID